MLIDDEVLNNLLKEAEESKKIKRIIKSAYICGAGSDYKDTAIQVKADDYKVIRNWLEGTSNSDNITVYDLKKIIDADHILAWLYSTEYGDPQYNSFVVSIPIEKVTSNGVVLAENEYELHFAPFSEYKHGWALNKEDFE